MATFVKTRDRRSLAHWSHDFSTVWISMIFHGDPRSALMIGFMHAYKVIIPSITNHTDFLIGRELLYPSATSFLASPLPSTAGWL
jgi:hypothetical protein